MVVVLVLVGWVGMYCVCRYVCMCVGRWVGG